MRRLATLRRQRLLTQKELAQQVGVSLQALQNWEYEHAWPRVRYIRRLCEVLGVTLDELLTPEEKARVLGDGDEDDHAA
jgi:transcriptional regulator with XRE-family HTH domain